MVDRGQQVEQLVARYGLCTVSAVAARLFEGLTEKAAERVITRLLAAGRLVSQPLVGRRCCYVLSQAAARSHGLDPDHGGLAMGAQSVLQNYAMMAFCLLGEPRHERLTRPEFVDKFPILVAPGAIGRMHRTRYYLDVTERAAGIVRLGLMVADLGSHPRRLVRKVRREIERRRMVNGDFKTLIDQRYFTATVLTAFPAKARQLAHTLAAESFQARVVVVPGYDELLGGRRETET